MRAPHALALAAGVTAGLVAALGACAGETFDAQVSQTSTVTVGNARVLRVEMPVLVDVSGSPLRRDVRLALTGVLTASTSSRAQAAVESLRVEVARPDADTTVVSLAGLPSGVRLDATAELQVPDALDLVVLAAPGARVVGMDGDVSLRTNGGVQVEGVRGSLEVSTAGGAIVATPLLQSTRLAIEATGAVIVRLPASPSGAFDVQGQSIVVRHPKLPQPLAGAMQYRQTVNGGLAEVVIQSTAASVTLDP